MTARGDLQRAVSTRFMAGLQSDAGNARHLVEAALEHLLEQDNPPERTACLLTLAVEVLADLERRTGDV